ncbi:VIP peptides isoform X2 [Protopterus annectens]|uniref:VIP peptides isoform X2 n=1 Tax=Protopterus annectens TaxID=7888 RepID=UPI001CF97BB3|nr:VIP peptides isoform X2 [Protopterus annectens]
MECKSGSPFLIFFTLLSIIYSQAFGLPALGTYSAMRATRHADGLFTSGYSKLLGQLSARRYLESLIGKRVSNNMVEDQMPAKRHSDAIFTDNYSRFRKQMAVKKYLNSVLTGKRSLEEISPASLREDVDVSEPSFSENYDDATVDELLNHLPLTL